MARPWAVDGLLLVLFLGFVAGQNDTGATEKIVKQGILLAKAVPIETGPDTFYSLRSTPDSKLWRLHFPDSNIPKSLRPGTHIKVWGRVVPGPSPQVIEVLDVTSLPTVSVSKTSGADAGSSSGSSSNSNVDPGGSTMGHPGATYSKQLNVLVLILDICGHAGGAATSRPAVEALVFGNASDPSVLNLQSYVDACSSGRSFLSRNTSRVLDPILIDCSGEMADGTPWGSSSCNDADTYGWADQAIAKAKAQLGAEEFGRYRHVVLVLNKELEKWGGEDCYWTGLGQIGPYQTGPAGEYLYGVVWVSGDFWDSLSVWLHELGHNLYLGHAGKGPDCDYCDTSCNMGFCCAVRCFNAAHTAQLGWARSAGVLNTSAMPIGQTVTNMLMPHLGSKINSVLPVQVDHMTPRSIADLQYNGQTAAAMTAFNTDPSVRNVSGPYQFLYIGYRTALPPYDASVDPSFWGGVNVYGFNNTNDYWSEPTHHLATLVNSTTWAYEPAGLVVRTLQTYPAFVIVGLCRYNEVAEQSCNDGIDNDCNGLADMDDPACQPKPPPPPTPPPVPPPNPSPPPPKLLPPPPVIKGRAPRSPPPTKPPPIARGKANKTSPASAPEAGSGDTNTPSDADATIATASVTEVTAGAEEQAPDPAPSMMARLLREVQEAIGKLPSPQLKAGGPQDRTSRRRFRL